MKKPECFWREVRRGVGCVCEGWWDHGWSIEGPRVGVSSFNSLFPRTFPGPFIIRPFLLPNPKWSALGLNSDFVSVLFYFVGESKFSFSATFQKHSLPPSVRRLPFLSCFPLLPPPLPCLQTWKKDRKFLGFRLLLVFVRNLYCSETWQIFLTCLIY